MWYNTTPDVEEEHRHLPAGWLAALVIIAIIGIFGNLLIIGAVCLSERLRIKGHAFTINLAMADLVVSCYIMPIGLATSQLGHNQFGQGLCGFNAFLIMTSCGVSTQSLMLIALERYFHICQTPYHRKIFSKPLIGIYISLTWFYTAIWTCQGWTGWTRYIYGVDIWLCMFDGPYSITYDVCLVLFGMLLPMIILCFCYTKIFLLVHKNNKVIKRHKRRPNRTTDQDNLTDNQKRTKKEFRLTLTLVVIVLVFCVCWTPASIVLLMAGAWKSMPKLFYTVAVWFALTNSSMNSILYGFLNKNFRDGYKRVLREMLCCKDKELCTIRHCNFLAPEEHSNSSRQHSNDTAKTDTLAKKKNLTVRPSTAIRRPNSVTDIRIEPVQLWSPEEVDRSCRYMQECSTSNQNNHTEPLQIPNTPDSTTNIDSDNPFNLNSDNHPPTPGSIETLERPSSCRSRVTTLLNTEEVMEPPL